MSPQDWLLVLAVCTAGAVSPGPSLLLLLGIRARDGRGAALTAACGHGLGIGLYALTAAFGLAAVALALPGVALALSLLGGLYLLWLAYGFWPRGAGSDEAHAAPAAGGAAVQGLLIALLNPKVMLFYAGIFAALVPVSASAVERLGLGLLPALIDAGWYALVALAGGAIAGPLARPGVQRALALLLGACGAWVLLRALGV